MGKSGDGPSRVTSSQTPQQKDCRDVLPRWMERIGSWLGGLWARVWAALVRGPRDRLDEEFRDVFLAEVDELYATLEGLLPGLRSEPLQPSTLQGLRRAFHTLKGSGLMAGAPGLAAICRNLEQLAVRVADKRTAATPEVVSTFEQAIALLPACRRALAASAPLPAAMRAIGRRAERLLGGS